MKTRSYQPIKKPTPINSRQFQPIAKPTPIASKPVINSTRQAPWGVRTYPGALGIMGSFKKGGKVKKTGPYKLHKGEKVVSKDKVAQMEALKKYAK